MYGKLFISLAIVNLVSISSINCYVASNYPRDDAEYRRGYVASGGSQRGVKGGSRRGNVIETTTNEGTVGVTDGTGYDPYRIRPYPSSVDPTRSRTEENAGSRYRGYSSRDSHDSSAFGQTRDSRTDAPSPFRRTDVQGQETDNEYGQNSRQDGQNRYQGGFTGRYDSTRGSSFRQDSNEFSRNDYRGHRGRSEGNEDLNRGNYRGYGQVDTSNTDGYRSYEGRTVGVGRNPELSSGSFRVDGNSRVDESRTSGQRLSSDTDVPVPSSGVKTKTRRINYIGQGEPGIHY